MSRLKGNTGEAKAHEGSYPACALGADRLRSVQKEILPLKIQRTGHQALGLPSGSLDTARLQLGLEAVQDLAPTRRRKPA